MSLGKLVKFVEKLGKERGVILSTKIEGRR